MMDKVYLFDDAEVHVSSEKKFDGKTFKIWTVQKNGVELNKALSDVKKMQKNNVVIKNYRTVELQNSYTAIYYRPIND